MKVERVRGGKGEAASTFGRRTANLIHPPTTTMEKKNKTNKRGEERERDRTRRRLGRPHVGG